MITAPQRILVPVDAGPESEAALAQAAGLTAGLDAELVLLVVVLPTEADAAIHHSDVPVLVVPSWGEQPADPRARR